MDILNLDGRTDEEAHEASDSEWIVRYVYLGSVRDRQDLTAIKRALVARECTVRLRAAFRQTGDGNIECHDTGGVSRTRQPRLGPAFTLLVIPVERIWS